MYHWVPRIISGESQMSGARWNRTMSRAAMGKNRLFGNAAMNWAMGWIASASLGRRPTVTPIGTHIRLASAISTSTRSRVRPPRPNTARASLGLTSEPM